MSLIINIDDFSVPEGVGAAFENKPWGEGSYLFKATNSYLAPGKKAKEALGEDVSLAESYEAGFVLVWNLTLECVDTLQSPDKSKKGQTLKLWPWFHPDKDREKSRENKAAGNGYSTNTEIFMQAIQAFGGEISADFEKMADSVMGKSAVLFIGVDKDSDFNKLKFSESLSNYKSRMAGDAAAKAQSPDKPPVPSPLPTDFDDDIPF